jgi:hypothetical protein
MFQSFSISEQLWQAWAYLTHTRMWAILFGIVFAVLAITLLIASRTRWGQAKPLTKCVVLSVLAHVWLLMYALGTRTVLPQGDPHGSQQNMSVSFEESLLELSPASVDEMATAEEAEDAAAAGEPMPWERPVPLAELPQPSGLQGLSAAALSAPALLPALEPTPMPALPPPELFTDSTTEEPQADPSADYDSSTLASTSVAEPAAAESDAVLPPSLAVAGALAAQSVAVATSPVLPPTEQLPVNPHLPEEYQLRQAANRLQLSAAYGADADSEAAVAAGLLWLANAQSPDGSWNAKEFGGGTETLALGEHRFGTGDRADTGVSGLALLAFLSAGHTHLEGEYQPTVQHGLEFLLRAQMPSGDLSGPKQVGNERSVLNARMYCHSIATLALAEAYAMTGDAVLRENLMRATQYSINAQDVRGGGWRYRPHDPGDLSQFGWQAMALKSVERSGIKLPVEVKRRMRRFLDSCAAGQADGLATYRPGEGRPSATMTAEALACRLLLDYPTALPAQQEALRMIMSSPPGVGEDNVYFWYYATLALFQLQDENWRAWNQAMKSHLLSTQVPAYRAQPGSWEPDGMWGGYGGRVYSTAMSCLCLEVYYRYLPMYQRANLARHSDSPSYSR